ncbi:hypothetical protein DCCM_0762 [Desulfocucumis palustris]|uniref:Uncharacterized protein n=1 Tax=Desulfocucumis palustris TaxID=1898651 RepID=A0A2L2XE99_9FIRM|nr:hypothetical protein DCCM_0762 [Desulfocucumis palustris]
MPKTKAPQGGEYAGSAVFAPQRGADLFQVFRIYFAKCLYI